MSGMTADALRSGIDFRKPNNDYSAGRPSVIFDGSLDTIQTGNRNGGLNDTGTLQKRANVSKALEMNRVFPINLSYQMQSNSQGTT